MARSRVSAKATNPTAQFAPVLPPDRTVIPRGRMFASVLDLVGGTPLVRLPRLQEADHLVADIALKLEFFNPLGSVKDRIGLAMVEAAEQAGEIEAGKTTIVEPTSGNTGIALAFVAAAKGYKLIVVMPEGASVERRKLLRLLGAQVESTPAKLGMPGAIARADSILARTPGAWIARQFDNPANPAAHQATTAEEIWADTNGMVDFVVGGVGTGRHVDRYRSRPEATAASFADRRRGAAGERGAVRRQPGSTPHTGDRRRLHAKRAGPLAAGRGLYGLRSRVVRGRPPLRGG